MPPRVEEFPDYASWLEGDLWPSGSLGETKWVGDMAPQHAAAAIYKLKRWATGQWADEVRNEIEWANVMQARLYRHLAAMATGQDFVDAVTETVAIRGVMGSLTPGDAARLLARALLDTLDSMSPQDCGRLATEISVWLTNHHHHIGIGD